MGQLDDLAADPHVALQHLGRKVAERLLEDVLAGRAPARAAGDDVLQALEAGPCILLDRLARRQRRFEAFHRRLGVGKALPKLGRLGFLCLAARLQARPGLSDVAPVAFGPLYQGPAERGPETESS